jgi:hypothetical protein
MDLGRRQLSQHQEDHFEWRAAAETIPQPDAAEGWRAAYGIASSLR